MRDALYRLAAPILDRIPDISHQPKGRQISIGFAASLIFHLLLLLFAAGVGFLLPEHSLVQFIQTKPKLQEIEIMVIPVQEVTELVTPEDLEKRKQFMDSAGLTASATAPDKPLVESDVNMKAGSQLPARGDTPLPTQDGRKDRAFPQFDNQKSKVGEVTPDPTPPAAPPPAAPAPATPKTAEAKPEMAEPAKEPDPKLKPVEAPAPDEIAMATRPKEAAPEPIAPPSPPAPKLRMRTSAPIAMLTTPAPVSPPKSSYQEEREKTQIDGNITNAGPKGVDAEGTPLGVYMKGVKAAIGSRWNHYVTGNGGSVLFPPGSIRVSFVVDDRGKIARVKTNGNTSSSAYGFACEKAVRDTRLPAPRQGLFNELPENNLEITYTFTIYGF